MEFIYRNVKDMIDSAAKQTLACGVKKVILTHDEWNELFSSMSNEEASATKSIGYRKMIYNGIIVHAQER